MASGVCRMSIWIRAKSTAWSCHGNVGRPLISYHMEAIRKNLDLSSFGFLRGKGHSPRDPPSQAQWPLHSSKNHILEQQCPPGGMRSRWTRKGRGQQAQKQIKDGDNFPLFLAPSLPREPGCSCTEEHGRSAALWADKACASDLKGAKSSPKALANPINGVCIFLDAAGMRELQCSPKPSQATLNQESLSPKVKHGQAREASWPLAQPPFRARIL